ncbi:hypothetical protein [Streptomyces sp. NPDC051561]|uniref:hypothetical protein n=1 Tax=Streptomyces sp. NPDC051561 TaxID=3365658 RepID=UPI00378AB819
MIRTTRTLAALLAVGTAVLGSTAPAEGLPLKAISCSGADCAATTGAEATRTWAHTSEAGRFSAGVRARGPQLPPRTCLTEVRQETAGVGWFRQGAAGAPTWRRVAAGDKGATFKEFLLVTGPGPRRAVVDRADLPRKVVTTVDCRASVTRDTARWHAAATVPGRPGRHRTALAHTWDRVDHFTWLPRPWEKGRCLKLTGVATRGPYVHNQDGDLLRSAKSEFDRTFYQVRDDDSGELSWIQDKAMTVRG